MMTENLIIGIFSGKKDDEFCVLLRKEDGKGSRWFPANIDWEPVVEGIDQAGKMLSISKNAAQAVMDNLYDLGVRASRADPKPSEPLVAETKHTHDPENTQALRSHLADMRVIAFRSIGAEPPHSE